MTKIQTWRDAEHAAAGWLRPRGFLDARVTECGADEGVDVRSRRAIAQVKFQSAPVGRPALQQLVGARARRSDVELVFYSRSGYSKQAIEYASLMNIALFTYAASGKVAPVNSAARVLGLTFTDVVAGVCDKAAMGTFLLAVVVILGGVTGQGEGGVSEFFERLLAVVVLLFVTMLLVALEGWIKGLGTNLGGGNRGQQRRGCVPSPAPTAGMGTQIGGGARSTDGNTGGPESP